MMVEIVVMELLRNIALIQVIVSKNLDFVIELKIIHSNKKKFQISLELKNRNAIVASCFQKKLNPEEIQTMKTF